MNILITGGSGYIGSKLVKKLSKNHKVINFDIKNGQNLIDKKKVNKIFEDNKIDLVIHLAALAGVEKKEDSYLSYFNHNVAATLYLLEAMRKNKVNKILFSSSCSVYGSNKNCSEEDDLNPESFYGLSKVISEKLILFYSKKYNIKYNIFRLFNVVGHGSSSTFNKTRIFPLLIEKIEKNKDIHLFLQSNGKETCIRDYVDIEFVCEIFIKFLNNLTNDIYNIGSGKGYSGQEVANKIFEILNKKTNIIYTEKRNGDPDISISNNKKLLKHKIKYRNKSIEETIKDARCK